MSDVSGAQICHDCGQVDHGQTGEYPCPTCGLPRTWDAPVAGHCAWCDAELARIREYRDVWR